MLRQSLLRSFRNTSTNNMKVIVGVKRVVDYTVKIRVKDNKVQTDGVKMSVNPFDEIAIEEAIRLKEKKIATEVIAVTIGPKKSEEVLRTAMALGCDRAVHIVAPETASLEPLAIAKLFAKIHEQEKPDLWILGKQAVDGDFGSTPQLLAGLLDVPQGTFASEVVVAADKKSVKVTREIDAGRQVVELTTPAVIAADLRLNTPRFPNLQSIMKARKKPIEAKELASLGVDTNSRLETVTTVEPPVRKAGVKVKTVDELFEKLRNEAKVL